MATWSWSASMRSCTSTSARRACAHRTRSRKPAGADWMRRCAGRRRAHTPAAKGRSTSERGGVIDGLAGVLAAQVTVILTMQEHGQCRDGRDQSDAKGDDGADPLRIEISQYKPAGADREIN